MLAHAAPGNVLPTPPNKPLKLSRPGFGPAAEPPGPNSTSAVSRRLQISRCCPAVCAAAAVPRGIATWASAVQLTGMAVSPTGERKRSHVCRGLSHSICCFRAGAPDPRARLLGSHCTPSRRRLGRNV